VNSNYIFAKFIQFDFGFNNQKGESNLFNFLVLIVGM